MSGCWAIGDLPVLVSELVTNAVKHTASGRPGGVLDVLVSERGGTCGERLLRVEVVDCGSSSVPVAREPTDFGSGGRGLWIVQSLAETWGFWKAGGKQGVWFELRADAGTERRAAGPEWGE
ncbi:ATP-binding protein [Nonomuraea sp. NBC_01738]|nr:ATP-binding protein [Nonomuraea sp. NBC_01738]